MSEYARKHHPQVQARRDPNAITLNAYGRNCYVLALEHFGHSDARRLSKVDAWKRVCSDPRVVAYIKSETHY